MKKKGLSMVMFVIAIAVVLVLVTAFTTSYEVILRSVRIREFANEINSLQKAVDEYKFMNGEYPYKSDEYTFDISTVKDGGYGQFGKTTGTMKFYIIDLNKLGIDELKRGTTGTNLDVYAVSKENGKVYYLAGEEIAGDYYYTLVDEMEEKLDI